MPRIYLSNDGLGAVGKTAVRYLQYLAQATGRPLAGEHVHVRCPVLITSLEDGIDEVRRRLRALRLHYNIPIEELKGWLFYWSPNGHKLVVSDQRGQRVLGELEPELRELITKHHIGLVGIDPFIKSHSCDENDNSAVDAVCIILSKIATDLDCGIDLLQHHRKGALSPGDAESGRGASALKDAARLVRTITAMTDVEAETFGITKQAAAHLVRIDDAKINLVPRITDARWFQLVGVRLENGNELYPNGDTVQAAEPWHPPDPWQEMSTATANQILDVIERGPSEDCRFSGARQAGERIAAWRVVQSTCPQLTDKQCQAFITTWIKNGVLEIRSYDDPVRREPRPGLYVLKRPG